MIKKILLLAILVIIVSCDSPFNTNTSEDDIFDLTISHDISRVMPTAQILLSWSEITVENFQLLRIERMTTSDTAWTLIVELKDELLTSYLDTIGNDEDLLYRVGIVNSDNDIVWANGSTTIPRTTSTIVPDEFATIQPAFESDLIDDGDTILVKSGIYIETLYISGKDVLIYSINGYENTILQPTFTENANEAKRVVSISSGILDGFTIELGQPSHAGNGGGAIIAQDAEVINCYISGNESMGLGGGVFITDHGNLYNCIITGDTASVGRGIYLSNAHGKFINNTFAYNSLLGDEVVIAGNCEGLIFRNNIVINPTAEKDIRFVDLNNSTGVTIDYLLLDSPIDFGSNNLIGDPQFIDRVEFRVTPNSIGVDAGHPDEEYRDIDDTRNDIGAYGGPRNRK